MTDVPGCDFEGPVLDALIELMFLAAAADGDVCEAERDELAANVDALTDGRLGGEALLAQLSRIAAHVQEEGREARLRAVCDRLPPDCREDALVTMVRITMADRVLHPNERALVFEAAEVLGLDRETATAVLDEVTAHLPK
jgi:uncharacterized tellurite resistance protein B-like protein